MILGDTCTLAGMADYAPSCDLNVPGRMATHGPGWYLIAENQRVEAGPFATDTDARMAARWMEDNGWGVNPAPWSTRHSAVGLLVGSRFRLARPKCARVDTLAG